MSEATGDRSHAATPDRRRQARQEGHVARSQDLAAAAVLLGALATLLYFGGRVVAHLMEVMREYLGGEVRLSLDVADVSHLWYRLLMGLAVALLPILALMMVWSVLSMLLQVGFLWLPQQVSLDTGRVSPLRGLSRLFSSASAWRVVLALVKITAVGAVAAYSLYGDRGAIVGAAGLELTQLARFMAEIILTTSLKAAGTLLAIGLCDFGFQWWQRERDLRMTTQEVRDEMRNLQGNPQTTAGRRAVQRRRAASIER